MNDPWQLLILDPNTATVRDVKAAYARLLKIHRPDKDPEGFTRVREAYEAALAWVTARESRPHQDTPAVGDSDSDGPPPPVPSGPEPREVADDAADADEWQAAVNALRRAVSSQDAEGVSQATEHLLTLAESTDMPADKIAKALSQALGNQLESIAAVITDSLLLHLVHGGESGIAHLVVAHWQQLGKLDRLQRFGEHLADLDRPADDQDEALIMARAGTAIGFWEPGLATTLGNAAFPRLPAEIRERVMGELEHECSLGSLFGDFPREMRHFWKERSSYASQPFDWTTPEAQDALEYTAKMRNRGWNGLGYIKSILPEDVWISLVRKLESQGARLQHPGLVDRRQPNRLRFIFSACAVGILILNFLSTFTRSYSTYRENDPHRYSQSETDPQRLYEKFLNKTLEIPSPSQPRQISKRVSPYDAITTTPKPLQRPDSTSSPSVKPVPVPAKRIDDQDRMNSYTEPLYKILEKEHASPTPPPTKAYDLKAAPAPAPASASSPSENDLRNGTLWQGAVPGLRR